MKPIEERLDEIDARANAATPGRWYSEESDTMWQLFAEQNPEWHPYQLIKAPKKDTPYAEYWPTKADAEFITNARQDVPDLVAYARELKAKVETLEGQIADITERVSGAY